MNPNNRTMESNTTHLKEEIVNALRNVYDPELPVNIYDLGLIYDIDVLPLGRIAISMTLTSPSCPVAGSLPGEVEQAVSKVSGVQDVAVELVWDPPWDQSRMSEDAKLELNLF